MVETPPADNSLLVAEGGHPSFPSPLEERFPFYRSSSTACCDALITPPVAALRRPVGCRLDSVLAEPFPVSFMSYRPSPAVPLGQQFRVAAHKRTVAAHDATGRAGFILRNDTSLRLIYVAAAPGCFERVKGYPADRPTSAAIPFAACTACSVRCVTARRTPQCRRH